MNTESAATILGRRIHRHLTADDLYKVEAKIIGFDPPTSMWPFESLDDHPIPYTPTEAPETLKQFAAAPPAPEQPKETLTPKHNHVRRDHVPGPSIPGNPELCKFEYYGLLCDCKYAHGAPRE